MTDPVDAYVRFFETMSPETLDTLDAVATPDIRFRDPFNDVRGIDALRAILAAMFEDIEQPRFTVTHRVCADGVCFVRWRFTGKLRRLSRRSWEVIGMSELRLAEDGRVSEHIDHWDAAGQFYEMLPILGPVIRLLRRRIAHAAVPDATP